MASPEVQLDFIPTRNGTNFRRRTRGEVLRSQARKTAKAQKEKDLELKVGINVPDRSIVAALKIFGVSGNRTIGRVIVFQEDPKTKEWIPWEYAKAEPADLLKELSIRAHFAINGAEGFGPAIDVKRTFPDFGQIYPRDTGFVTQFGGVVFKEQREPRRIYGISEGFRITVGGEVGIYRRVKPGQLDSLKIVAPERIAS